ncbi:MAG: chitobiase/beta-hexosaminidase C-terminal domain-containing protein, partial [Bacillota bacterium]
MGSSGVMGAESLHRKRRNRNHRKCDAIARAAGAVSVEPLEARCLLAADVMINEFLADNKAGLVDKDRDHSDWIEIYNPGSATNLSGWHLTDDPTDPDKWTFPNTPLGAGSYLVVFASGKDMASAGQELHTNFKLDADGEYLTLIRPDGTVASQYAPTFPPQATDVSYGLGPATTGGATIVMTGDNAKVRIPSDESLGTNWISPSFDDSTWMDAMTGVGFEWGGPLPNEVEPNDSISAANSAVYNFSAYSGDLYHLGITGETGSSDDWFKIGAMQAGDVITIAGSGAPSARGNASDVHIELWRAGSTAAPVASDDDSGPGADALIDRFTVTANDVYYVVIRRQTSSVGRGTYSLNLWLQNIRVTPVTGGSFTVENESSGNNSMASSNDASTSWRAAQYRSRTVGEIASTADSDVYQYQLSAGDLLTVNIRSTSTLHAKVSLLDSAGKVVAKEDGTSVTSPATGDGFLYSYVVPTTGAYYVQVQGTGSTTGTYSADLYLSSNTALPAPSLWGSYAGQITINIGPQMYGTNASAYIRIPFRMDDPAQFSKLILSMKYDDGFVAYLNGQRVASRNAPASPEFNSTATGIHQSAAFEDIDITEFKAALVPGDNLLAIQGLNRTTEDSDFLLLPELRYTSVIPGGQQYFSSPTPGAVNQPGSLGIVKDTKFSVDRGLYDAPIDVTITTATSGAQIRYTTDGREPTATTGIVYTGPIHITTTTTLRAAAFKPGYLPSTVDTQTYIFLQDVIHQPASPAGFPSQWINTRGEVAPGNPSADYAMDPEVVDDPAYSSEMIDALRSLPTMSLVMNVDDLFGNGPNGTNGIKGIYSNPESWDPDGATTKQWRRSASLELIYPDGTQGFQINAAVQIHGGGSRVPTKNPKHSFTVSFRDSEDGELNFPLFGEDATDEFESIVLSGRYNNSWVHMEAAQRARGQYIQDQWNTDTQFGMGDLSRHANFVHLYINGLYWGIYNPTEMPNAAFAESYLGGQEEDYDVVKISDHGGLRAVDGDLAAWNTMFAKANAGLASDAAYQDFQKYLDIPSFIDYMILKFYGADGDWDQHNWIAIRRSRTDGIPNDTLGGFQFVNWDNERTLEEVNQNVIGAEQTSQGPQHLFNRLIQNAE